jgi:hypothetical protein
LFYRVCGRRGKLHSGRVLARSAESRRISGADQREAAAAFRLRWSLFFIIEGFLC